MSTVSYVVEGDPDEEVLKRLAIELDIKLRLFFKGGKSQLKDRIIKFNQYAHFYPLIVLVDLDEKIKCAPCLKTKWIPNPNQFMCFRVVIREIETWLLTDKDNIAKFLSIDILFVPSYPETIADPKKTMIDLAKRSRKKNIREDMVPRPGSDRKIGPAYNSRLIEFIRNYWKPEIAAEKSDSLQRCIKRLRELY